MSIYNHRYHAHFAKADGMAGVSGYFDTWDEFERLCRHYYPQRPCHWVNEGYGEESDGPNGSVCTTRRTTGVVPEHIWKAHAAYALAVSE